ncbi:MAG: SprT family zinc-dependent metalloprotease [Bacteroidales bacterium]|jgi:hypothetical protein
MEILTINDIEIEIERKNIKNIHLRIYPPDARVHISAPKRMALDTIRLFVISKMIWINKKVELVKSREFQSVKEYISGENHYYKGNIYILNVIYKNSTPKVEINESGFINLYVREGSSTKKKEAVLREWYRKELKEEIEPIVKKWEKVLGVEVNDWDVKKLKTIWGSCNTRTHHILFNLELIKKPAYCIEYVVLHELTHLIVRLHNAKFHSIVETRIPNWKEIKTELNNFIL